jgi:hypothetical protein
MKIKDCKMLTMLFCLMGLDNGAHVSDEADVPEEWQSWFAAAESELPRLSSEEAETLAQGAEEDQVEVKVKAPYAARLLDAAFDDGPLAELVFTPWTTAIESVATEAKYRDLVQRLEADGA